MNEGDLQFGIIGAGSRGKGFANRLNNRSDTKIAAICDTNTVRMKYFKEGLAGPVNCYQDAAEMCGNENLAAVIVTTPDRFHCENALEVLKHGLDVFIDKPLATNVTDCQKILNAADESGKTVMIGFNLRHHPTLKRVKEIVEDGTLGRVFLIENREFYTGGRTYMSRWNRKYEISGGLWVHKGSHDFDVFNWLFDFPQPSKVSATAGLAVFKPENIPFDTDPELPVGPDCSQCAYSDVCPDKYEIDNPMWGEEARQEDGYAKNLCMYISDKDVHDHGMAFVEYENGARASHLECFTSSFSDRQYTIVGDKGQAEVSLVKRTILIRPRWSHETIEHKIPEVSGGHGGADAGVIGRFIDVVKGKTQNTSTAEHGLVSTAIGQAAEISWREDRTVFVEELMSMYQQEQNL